MRPEHPDTLIFHHIPKTAGTTFSGILDQVWDPEQIVTIPARNDLTREAALARLRKLDPEALGRVRVLRGHNIYGLHEIFPGRCDYLTIVRNPAERFISSYHHLRGAPPILPERKAFLDDPPTLEEYVERGDLYAGHDSLVKTFVGAVPPARELSGAEALEKALQALENRYVLVGLTEAFDDFVVLCNLTFDWRVRAYRTRNVNRRYERPDPDSDPVIQRYEELNPHDVLFYEAATRHFEEARARWGETFDRAMRRFRRTHVPWNLLRNAWTSIRRLGRGP